MRRLLFQILSALSLLLFLATASLWVRSYFTPDNILCTDHAGTLQWLQSHHGDIRWETATPWPNPEPLRVFSSGDASANREPIIRMWADRDAILAEAEHFGIHYRLQKAHTPVDDKGAASYGPHLGSTYRSARLDSVQVWIPFGWPAMLFAILPLLALIQRVRHRMRAKARLAAGLCSQCGYDLRASKNRCPECGAPILTQAEVTP